VFFSGIVLISWVSRASLRQQQASKSEIQAGQWDTREGTVKGFRLGARLESIAASEIALADTPFGTR
jgi:hypothetical protein